jgi:hypothetical protein
MEMKQAERWTHAHTHVGFVYFVQTAQGNISLNIWETITWHYNESVGRQVQGIQKVHEQFCFITIFSVF